LNAIIRQYTRSPIEEVRLDITDPCHFVACSLTFLSTDTTVIKFCFQIDEGEDTSRSFVCNVFSEACRAIRDLPPLANVKYLHIYGLDVERELIVQVSQDFEGVLKSLGPLEKLTIRDCDMRPWFLYRPEILEYPPIRLFTLIDLWDTLVEDAARGLVKLAKAQHESGVPFERVTVRSYGFADVEERLRPWVGTVDCVLYDKPY